MKLLLCSLLTLSLPATVMGLDLPLIKEPVLTRLPIPQESTAIPCDQILSRLQEYNDLARQSDQSMTGFLDEVAGKTQEWHGLLSPLEGQTQTLPVGTFSVLKDGGDKIAKITNLARENTGLLAHELDRIMTAYSTCHPK